MRRVALIGEVVGPGRVSVPGYLPLTPQEDGASADRLMALGGFTPEEYDRAFPVRANLFPSRSALRTDGSWPRRRRCLQAGEEVIRWMLREMVDSAVVTHVLLLGRARDGFPERRQIPCMEWAALSLHNMRVYAAWMPHSSGRSRVWNDEGNRQEARAFLRAIIE